MRCCSIDKVKLMTKRLEKCRKQREEKKKLKEQYKKFAERNVALGKEAEKVFIEILKKKYNKVIDNNDDDPYAHMDFTTYDTDVIDHEHKFRAGLYGINHDKFKTGLMVDRTKLNYSIERLTFNIRQIYYWTCLDGIYYWELTDHKKQENKEYTFSMNGNIKNNQTPKPVFNVKPEFLKKL